ncbi:MAG: hypothetical protein R2852_03480 [Bacteroidia bacterium]
MKRLLILGLFLTVFSGGIRAQQVKALDKGLPRAVAGSCIDSHLGIYTLQQ